MSLLFRVIYAAHANGSHHKLALDALRELDGPDAERWRRLFLKHVEAYLEGSKAPDNEFKDFKNHVLHVGDGYWGGALEASRTWYVRLVEELAGGRWADAAFSAGVLSHYVVDPIHPFHTGQSDAETNIHRAVEWSIAKSYDSLRSQSVALAADDRPTVGADEKWLEGLVCAGADHSNRHYHTLLAHYDFKRGVVDPPAGLDAVAQQAVAGLIAYAASAFGLVLDRAIIESCAEPPEVTLGAETVRAMLAVPRKLLLKRVTDAAERRQIEAMYDELQATGRVEQTLSEDDRIVRDLYAAEVESGKVRRQAAGRAERLKSLSVDASSSAVEAVEAVAVAEEVSPAAVAPAAAGGDTAALEADVPSPSAPLPVHCVGGQIEESLSPSRTRGPRLHLSDPVESAPSIGRKSAERLAAVGIHTVADLLAAVPPDLVARLAARHIDVDVVCDWQDQARLASSLPNLNGTNALLLVSLGCRTLADVSRREANELLIEMARLAASPAGERMARGWQAPAAGDVAAWIDAAARATGRAAA